MEYLNFWPGFTHPNSHTEFWEYVFQDVCKHKKVRLYSVFQGQEPLIRNNPDIVNVSYSGEPFIVDNPEEFDLNISTKTGTPKNIMYPLCAIVSYACDYWKDYTQPRCDPAYNTKFCSFVVSNEKSIPRRKFFRYLSEYKKVDSFGWCDNNTGVRAPSIPMHNGGDIRHPQYLDFIRGYKFMICFENDSQENYLTEKLFNAWLSGAVPIYWGCPKALEWLNPEAFLYLENDSDDAMIELARTVAYLDKHPEEYAKYHAQPLLRSAEIPHDLNRETLRQNINEHFKN
jgi:Glycosyltransferase family 10 (fucosyltransferase) C-term